MSQLAMPAARNEGSVRPRLPKLYAPGLRVAVDVEPPVQARLRGTLDLLLAAADVVGTNAARAEERAQVVALRRDLQRVARLEIGDAADAPSRDELIRDAADVAQEVLPFAERQIVHVAHRQVLRHVEADQGAFGLQVSPVLDAAYLRFEEAGEPIGIADQLGPGVGNQNRAARAEALLELCLQRVVDRVAGIRRQHSSR